MDLRAVTRRLVSEPRVSRKGNNPPLDGGKQSLRSRESRIRAASPRLGCTQALDTYLDVVVARCGGCAIMLRPNPLSLSLSLSLVSLNHLSMILQLFARAPRVL